MGNNSQREALPERFRCHPSIILEDIGAFFIVIMIVIIGNVGDELGEIQRGGWQSPDAMFTLWMILGGFIFVFGLFIGIFVRRWSKTFISIVDNTIVWEKNTLNKKKNTIGIKNISNVNIEQNILEMILGTCKVKLDTNSLSTADSTDFKIVLKKSRADLFRKRVMELMNEAEGEESSAETESGQSSVLDIFEEKNYDVTASVLDIFFHGLCSIHIFTVVLAISSVVGIYFTIKNVGGRTGDLLSMLSAIIAIAFVFFSAVYNIAKGFFRYYGFQAKRFQNKIYLRYGLFKKVNYAIPVSKINAVCLNQTLIARICRRYSVELVNVGMGDENQEESSFLLWFNSLEQIREYLNILLPEFEMWEANQKITCEKQPLSSIFVKLFSTVWYILLLAGLIWFFNEFEKNFVLPVCIYGGALLVIMWLNILLSMLNDGVSFGSKYMITIYGRFGKTYKWIAYDKVQYVQLKQNIWMKKLGIIKGNVFVLASLKNRVQNLPFFSTKNVELLKERMLNSPER